MDSPKFSLGHFLRSFPSISPTQMDSTRDQLESHLVGSDFTDIYAFSVLVYHLGVRFDTCLILLEAFPTLTVCDLDVHWEVLNENYRGRNRRRNGRDSSSPQNKNDSNGMIFSNNRLEETVLVYLRKRLCLGTNEILGIIKVSTNV